MSGDGIVESIGPLAAFFKKLPSEIMDETIPQFWAACEALNEHNESQAEAYSGG